jgi:serine/threonine protein kinase
MNDSSQTALLLGPAPRSAANLIGGCYGPFRIVEFIGEGGIGSVYRAERTDGIRQVVAVELIARELGLNGPQQLVRATQLLARLEHPSIARLIDFGIATALEDGGSADDPTADIGRPFTPHFAAPEHRSADEEPLLLNASAILERDRGATLDRTQAAYKALRDLFAATGRAAQAAEWQSTIASGGA